MRNIQKADQSPHVWIPVLRCFICPMSPHTHSGMTEKDAVPGKFVAGSRTMLNAFLSRGDIVPDEVQRVQELVECMDNTRC
ncbi:hypothetical protein PsorP6_007633 [Peronosclerospora sorghi]|uniref:Uncharacterized protein n=1 Tax=Peronosclerospora sorghi TaxID=230839 RepID=A0ACC0WA06_9STRA|nr:hypothetical protein PsorP6_007633 [Peronosclerospora sorghi]